MTEQDREKINEVVADAISLDTSERAAFLSGSELTEKQLAEARSLLSMADVAASMLDAPAIAFSKDFFPAEDAERLAGKSVGPFTIIKELGHGGMGAVYLASRKVGDKEQRVALKLLKREMNSSVFRQRFEQEREILATLSHPNISSLVDIGTADDGTPYFAMEYVDGLPIDEFCSENSYGRDQRLALFQKVCSAVASAHRSLVVHRDLKPSNILVTRDGTPKLLDFGISKIMSGSGEQDSTATVTRLGAMTPGYASPEQLNGESVTTATDIYSLGVILFELLSGHRPFEDKERDLKRILRAVAEDEPPLPSSKADTGEMAEKRVPISSSGDRPDEAQTLANPLRADTGKEEVKQRSPRTALRPQEIRGDLDRIVLKSLQKEPERRYLSVDAFNDDVTRFREGRPVVARPNTLLYRAGKFLRRNRAMALVGTLLLIAVIAGIVATLWQARIAQAERARAERRFEDVRALANSFLFEITPDIERLPGSTPAKTKLVTRALEYLQKLTDGAESDPDLMREIARAYDKVGDVQGNPSAPNIGDIKGALSSYQKALDIRLALLQSYPNDIDLTSGIADDYQMLGTLESFGGDYAKATPLLDRSLELRQKVLEADANNFDFRNKYASAVKARGLIPFFDGDNKSAIEYFERSQALYGDLLKEQPANDDVAADYYFLFINIGESLGWESEFGAALENIRKGVEPLKQIAARHPADQSMQRTLLLAYTKLGTAYEDLEKFDLGSEAYANGLAIAKATSEADPADHTAKRDVALAYKKLGQCQEGAGKLADSVLSLQKAVTSFTELFKSDPNNSEVLYDVANTTFSLGMTYASMKNYAEAISTYNRSLDAFKKVLVVNPAHTYARRMTAHNHKYLAEALAASHADNAKIAENYRLALEIFKALNSEDKLEKVDEPVIPEIEGKLAKL